MPVSSVSRSLRSGCMLNARGLSRFGLQKRIEKHLHVPRRLARRDHPQRSGVYTTMASCTLDKGRLTDHVSLTRRHSAKRATGMRYVQLIRRTEYISLETNRTIPLSTARYRICPSPCHRRKRRIQSQCSQGGRSSHSQVAERPHLDRRVYPLQCHHVGAHPHR